MCARTRQTSEDKKKRGEKERNEKGKKGIEGGASSTREKQVFHVLARYIFLAGLPRFLDFLPQLGIVKYDRGSVELGEKELETERVFRKIGSRRTRRNGRYYSPLAFCFTSVARGEVNFSGKAFRPDRIIRDKNGPEMVRWMDSESKESTVYSHGVWQASRLVACLLFNSFKFYVIITGIHPRSESNLIPCFVKIN